MEMYRLKMIGKGKSVNSRPDKRFITETIGNISG